MVGRAYSRAVPAQRVLMGRLCLRLLFLPNGSRVSSPYLPMLWHCASVVGWVQSVEP